MQNLLFLTLFVMFNVPPTSSPNTTLLENETVSLNAYERDAMFFSTCHYTATSGLLQIHSLFEVTKCEGISGGEKLFAGNVGANVVKLNIKKFPKGKSQILLHNDIDIEPFVLEVVKE